VPLVFSIAYDISKHVKAEFDLINASTSRYETLVNMLPVGVYRNTAGPKGHFLEANPTMIAMAGADSKEEFMKHTVSDLYQDPVKRAIFSEKLIREGLVTNEEIELVSLKGRKMTASVSGYC